MAPIIEEQGALNSTACGQSMPFQDNFMEQSMEDIPIAIDELSNSVPVNEERAIVLFNPNNNTSSLQTPVPFSISTDSHFLSRFKSKLLHTSPLLVFISVVKISQGAGRPLGMTSTVGLVGFKSLIFRHSGAFLGQILVK